MSLLSAATLMAGLYKVFEEKDTTRRQATEDVLWALINTPEFVFKD